MTEDDLSSVLALESNSYDKPWTLEHFLAELEKPFAQCWVLTDDETDLQIYGYCVFHTLGEVSDLLNVTVKPEARGFGFAAMMLSKWETFAQKKGEVHTLQLEVRVSNQSALKLYHRFGMVVSHVRKAFYDNGEDAVVLQKKLREEA